MKRSCHVLISGDVIGVGFRYHTAIKVAELGLKGWIRNTQDGCVEAVFEGEVGQIGKVLDWIKSGGPKWVEVETAEVRWNENLSGYEEFRVVQ